MRDPIAIITAALAVIGMFTACLAFVFTMRGALNQLQAELKDIKNEVKNVGNLMIVQGRHDERITMLQATQVAQGRRLDDTTRRLNVFVDAQALDIPEESPEN